MKREKIGRLQWGEIALTFTGEQVSRMIAMLHMCVHPRLQACGMAICQQHFTCLRLGEDTDTRAQ